MNNVITDRDSLAGKGVYANRNFKKDEIIVKYNLKPLTEQKFENLQESEREFTHTHMAILT